MVLALTVRDEDQSVGPLTRDADRLAFPGPLVGELGGSGAVRPVGVTGVSHAGARDLYRGRPARCSWMVARTAVSNSTRENGLGSRLVRLSAFPTWCSSGSAYPDM